MNLSLRSARRAAATGAIALAGLVVAPQAASAAVSCSYDGGVHAMNVTLGAAQDRATITRHPYGTLLVNGNNCGATVDNVDGIYVTDLSGDRTVVELDATAGSFAPGYTLEGLSSEIEIYVDLGAGNDGLTVDGEAYGAGMIAGQQGINLNAGVDAFGGDSDVKLSGVEDLTISGGAAHDRVSGQGGGGTGQPYAKRLNLVGGAGDDELHGGEAPSRETWIYGGAGDDLLVAGSSGGNIDGGPGNDTITGGPGIDDALYSSSTAGVAVDLAITGPQDTGGAGIDTITGVEFLTGTNHDDVLDGDGGGNHLIGSGGDDVLDGRGGNDYVGGGGGADTLRSGTGEDLLDGDAGEDTAAFDDAPGPVILDLSSTDPQNATATGSVRLTRIEDVVGSPFDDRLTGSADANAIDGGAGADTIDGREGADRLGGGAGIDAIDSRDSSPDSVSCGEGPDSLATDALDAVAPDCAQPTPGGGAGDGGGAGSDPLAPVLAVSVPRQSLRAVLKGGLRVVLSCSTACRAGGRLAAARATARQLGLSKRAARRLGRLASVGLAAGTPAKARVRLTRAARRSLRGAHRVRFVLRAHAVDGSGRAAAPVRMPVRLRTR